ncbi:MAG TPA: TlpA disulfide reductase family protein [Bryobacteraceae bacterium]
MRGAFVLLASAALLCAAPKLTPVDEAAYRALIASAKGKVVVVDFWATWCAPCRAEMPRLVQLETRYRARGVRLLTISCDEPEQEAGASGFVGGQRVPQPAYIKRAASDEKFIDSVDPKWSGALPALFVYDRQGKLVKSFIGETDMAALEEVLKKLL